jgi:predicted CoA-binding protein
MMPVQHAADAFLSSRRIAVTGVAREAKGHGANVVYRRLRDRGYEVFAVNPNADRVEGDRAYHSLADLPGGVDAVVLGTRPEQDLGTIRECVDLGVKQAWMHWSFGPGSVDHEAAAYGTERGMMVIEGGCPLMFAPVSDPGHHVMRTVCRWTHHLPKTVS